MRPCARAGRYLGAWRGCGVKRIPEHKSLSGWAGRHAGPLHRALGVDENRDSAGFPRLHRPSVCRVNLDAHGWVYRLAIGEELRILGTDPKAAMAELRALAKRGGFRG